MQWQSNLCAPILGATDAHDLDAAFGVINAHYLPMEVAGENPQAGQVLLKLSKLAGLPPNNDAKMLEYLRSPAAIIRDEHGVEIGRGVRFTLTPDSAILNPHSTLPHTCGERIWTLNGAVHARNKDSVKMVLLTLLEALVAKAKARALQY